MACILSCPCIPICWDHACQSWRVKYMRCGAAGNKHTKIHLSSPLTAIPEKFPDLWSVNVLKVGGARNEVLKFTHWKALLKQW